MFVLFILYSSDYRWKFLQADFFPLFPTTWGLDLQIQSNLQLGQLIVIVLFQYSLFFLYFLH